MNIPLDNRVASVFVHVSNLRESALWYSKLFGIPVMEERLNGGPVYWLELEGTHLILDSNSANRENPDWREDMKPRWMLPATNIDEAYRYVQEKAETIFEPENFGVVAHFSFRDLEGNVLMACWSQENDETEIHSRSPLLKIGGVFVDVKDMSAAARWYSELLAVPFNEEGAKQSIYPVPVSRGANLLLDQNRYLNHESYTELFYIETKDFEVALQYLKQQQFEFANEPTYFSDISEVAILDPDGNRIVIAEMK